MAVGVAGSTYETGPRLAEMIVPHRTLAVARRCGRVQYHPELKSRPFAPHPLFASFVEAAVEQGRLV